MTSSSACRRSGAAGGRIIGGFFIGHIAGRTLELHEGHTSKKIMKD